MIPLHLRLTNRPEHEVNWLRIGLVAEALWRLSSSTSARMELTEAVVSPTRSGSPQRQVKKGSYPRIETLRLARTARSGNPERGKRDAPRNWHRRRPQSQPFVWEST